MYRAVLCANLALLCLLITLKPAYWPRYTNSAQTSVTFTSIEIGRSNPDLNHSPMDTAVQISTVETTALVPQPPPLSPLSQCVGGFPTLRRTVKVSVRVSRSGLARAHQNLAGFCRSLRFHEGNSTTSSIPTPLEEGSAAWTYRRFCLCLLSLVSHPDACSPPPTTVPDASAALAIPNTADDTIKRLMVVAHADDESIFGALQLITEKGWLVVCVTCDHPHRALEFIAVVRQAGAVPAILGVPTASHIDRRLLAARLGCLLQRHEFQQIVTHGPQGEYGHTHHKEIFQTVAALVAANEKYTSRLSVFSRSNELLPEETLGTLFGMLRHHRSQYESIVFWHPYVFYQSVVPCKLRTQSPCTRGLCLRDCE